MGKSSEAEAEFRKALAIQQKLADDNPAVTDSAAAWRAATTTSAICCCSTGKSSEAEAELPQGAGDPTEAGRRQPRRHRFRSPGGQPHQPRQPAVEIRASHRKRRPSTARRWRSGRSWPTTTPPSPNSAAPWRGATTTSAGCCRIRASHRKRRPSTARRWRSTEAGRRQPRHHRISEGSGGQPGQDRLAARAGRKNGRGDRLLHAGRGDPAEARRGQLGNVPRQGFPGELPDQHGGRAPSVGEA